MPTEKDVLGVGVVFLQHGTSLGGIDGRAVADGTSGRREGFESGGAAGFDDEVVGIVRAASGAGRFEAITID